MTRIARLTRHAAFALASLCAATACDSRGDGPTGAGTDRPVHLSLAASVVAAPGAVIEGIVTFTPPAGAPIVIARDSLTVDTGGSDETLALTADVSDCFAAAGDGNPCTLGLSLRLTRSGVVLDESDRVLTVAPGATEITVNTVELYEVASVRITPSVPTGFEPADSVQLVAAALDRAGGTVAARSIAWSVEGTAATVSANGMLRAVAPGAATVRAIIGGRRQDLAVTVGPPTVSTLTIAPADTTVFVGGSAIYRVTARASSGAVLSGVPLFFTSDNAQIAGVNTTGTAQAIAPGTVGIRVSTTGRGGSIVSAVATLRVIPSVIAVNPTALSFETELNQPLPASQAVSVTSLNGGNVGTISIQTPIDTLLTASLSSSTVPATLTIRPSRALAPGANLTRTVVVRSSNPAVTSATVTVTLTGRTPTASFGRFSGLVVNASSGAPLGQATVTIRNLSNVQVGQVFTAGNGTWTSGSLAAGTYNITVSNPGFQDVQVLGQLLIGGPTIPITSLATVSMVSVSAGAGSIDGSVRDATTGDALNAATVELRAGAYNTSGAPLATTTTNSDGQYVFASRLAGTYTVRAILSGFAEGNVFVVVTGGTVTAPVTFLSPAGTNVAWRFVLSWGSAPQDLDAHLTGPILNSAARFHVYFGDRGTLVAPPFAVLDVDEMSGFGPETITMSQQIAGVYRYYVNNFSGTPLLRSSTARVDVYQGNTLIRQFFPPQQDGEYWTVFELSGSSITAIGTIGSSIPAVSAPAIGPRRQVDSASDRAAAEWYQLSPWTWRKNKR